MSALTALVIFILSIAHHDAAKILAVYPVPSISHQVVFRPLTQELVKRGHEVTVITTDPAFPKGQAPANLTEIDVHDFSYANWVKLFQLTSAANTDQVEMMKAAFHMVNTLLEMQLKVDAVQKILKEGKFDLLILEACVKPALVLSHVFKVPVIQVSSNGPVIFNVDIIGAAWHPLLFPSNLSHRLNNLTKWDKLIELWNLYRIKKALVEVEEAENAMIKKVFGPNVPTIHQLKNNVDMLFLNVHPLWESNRLVPPSVIFMGGLHQKPVKELPNDLKAYLDSSKNGVIYLSLGTNVQPSLLPPERIEAFVKVFSELPYDVLWKWDKDDLPGRTDNIRIFKWLPQSDLLRHPKIKVFITQGGLQSTDEAITAGVPLIGIPMLGDQWLNVERYLIHKIGVRLDMESLTEDKLKNAINNVIGDESYRQNIARLGKLMHDEPMSPLDRAVWWVEHVLRHGGGRHLRSPTANISWYEYLELDLVLTVLGVLLSLFSILVVIIYYLFSLYCKNKGKSKKLKNK